MYLQLAEKPKRINVSAYRRSPKVSAHQRRYPLNESSEIDNPYIFIPDFERGGGIYIKEDKFDSMPEDQFRLFIQKLAPLQPQVQDGGLSSAEFLATKAERKARRESRRNRKDEKSKSKADLRTAKGEAKKTKADAKKSKADKGGGFDWDKVKEVGGSLISKFTGKGGDEESGGGGNGGGGGEGGTPFYKNPVVIGTAVVLTLGGIYLATRPKKVA